MCMEKVSLDPFRSKQTMPIFLGSELFTAASQVDYHISLFSLCCLSVSPLSRALSLPSRSGGTLYCGPYAPVPYPNSSLFSYSPSLGHWLYV